MKTLKLILSYILGLILIGGGVMHFLKPGNYYGFIPDIFPQDAIIYISGVIELILGIGVFIPSMRHKASLGILLLMLAFLPLHVMDVFREHPGIGSHQLALIRLPFQFIFIGWAWFISRKDK